MLALVGNFFAQNYLPLLLLVCLLFLLLVDKSVARGTRKSLYSVLIIIFALLLCDFFDVDTTKETTAMVIFWNSTMHVPFWMIRNIASGVGYALRPLLLLFAISILFRPKKTFLVFVSLPGVFNAIVSVLSIWTGWVYSVEPPNDWSNGLLRLMYFCVIIFYLLAIVLMLAVYWHKLSTRERIGIFFVLISILISSYLDVVVGGYHTLILAIPAESLV